MRDQTEWVELIEVGASVLLERLQMHTAEYRALSAE